MQQQQQQQQQQQMQRVAGAAADRRRHRCNSTGLSVCCARLGGGEGEAGQQVYLDSLAWLEAQPAAPVPEAASKCGCNM
jgi:hypothetical protein